MGKSLYSAERFHDEEAAREWFEAARWQDGVHCPSCGSLDPYKTKKAGVYRCKAKECRRDFTVTTGSVMERSHAKLTQWAVAFAMAAASKKGFSAHQLHRTLNCQYNTAWFMFHRVREAMRRGSLDLPPLGGEGKIVEADETYIGKARDQHVSPKRKGLAYSKGGRSGVANKRAIVALVERGGNVRSFHVKRADIITISAIITENIARESRLHTDESTLYPRVGATFAAHETVSTPLRNTLAATFIPTRLRAFSRSSSAVCRRVPALRREAPTPLSRRIRFPL